MRTEEVNLAELLRISHREFDPRTGTIDEALLQSQWPALRDKLRASMRAWDEGCGVPVGIPMTANTTIVQVDRATSPANQVIRPIASPVPPEITDDTPVESVPRFTVPEPVSRQVGTRSIPEWKKRLAERAARVAKAQKSSNLSGAL